MSHLLEEIFVPNHQDNPHHAPNVHEAHPKGAPVTANNPPSQWAPQLAANDLLIQQHQQLRQSHPSLHSPQHPIDASTNHNSNSVTTITTTSTSSEPSPFRSSPNSLPTHHQSPPLHSESLVKQHQFYPHHQDYAHHYHQPQTTTATTAVTTATRAVALVMQPSAKTILERRARAMAEGRRQEARLTEDERRIVRRLRNRESAERCRVRRIEHSRKLEHQVMMMQQENDRLVVQAEQYRNTIQHLEKIVRGFAPSLGVRSEQNNNSNDVVHHDHSQHPVYQHSPPFQQRSIQSQKKQEVEEQQQVDYHQLHINLQQEHVGQRGVSRSTIPV